jgi:hypothetical protein
MSHLLAYLGIEIEADPPAPEPVVVRPVVIQRNGRLVTDFHRWYRAHDGWGPLKRGFEGDALDVGSLTDEGRRLAGILAACNTEQRKKLRGYVRSSVGEAWGA